MEEVVSLLHYIINTGLCLGLPYCACHTSVVILFQSNNNGNGLSTVPALISTS